jgi:hypothetical protein
MVTRHCSSALRLIAWATCARLASACSPAEPSPTCSPPHATFRLFIDAVGKPLPDDLRVTVRYGSGTEEYYAPHPDQNPQAVFCKTGVGDGGAADASGDESPSDPGVYEVVCELWTDGAANVKVKGSGYPTVERDFAAKQDACGIVLTEEHISLEPGD